MEGERGKRAFFGNCYKILLLPIHLQQTPTKNNIHNERLRKCSLEFYNYTVSTLFLNKRIEYAMGLLNYVIAFHSIVICMDN